MVSKSKVFKGSAVYPHCQSVPPNNGCFHSAFTPPGSRPFSSLWDVVRNRSFSISVRSFYSFPFFFFFCFRQNIMYRLLFIFMFSFSSLPLLSSCKLRVLVSSSPMHVPCSISKLTTYLRQLH